MTVTQSGAGKHCVFVAGLGATVNIGAGMVFGANSGFDHMNAYEGGTIKIAADYAIAGGARRHFNPNGGGSTVSLNGKTATLSGTPAFTQFVYCSLNSVANIVNATFAGTGATGTRYRGELNATINTNGGGASYFPGDAAGSTASEGLYN